MLMRAAKALLAFAVGAGAALVYTQTIAANPKTFWNTEFYNHAQKIEAERHATHGTYAIAFGASLTALNFVPGTFEQSVRDRGLDLRIYNLGILGATGHEVDYYLRKTILHLEGLGVPLPEYVLIDCTLPFSGYIPEKHRETARAIEWHSLRETLSALKSLSLAEGRIGTKRGAAEEHLSCFLQKHLPLGRFHTILKEPTKEQMNREQFLAGFQLLPSEPVKIDPERFEKLIEEKIAYLQLPGSLAEFNVQAFIQQMRFLMERGIVPIYFLPPSPGDSRSIYRLEELGTIPYLPAFDDPREHPEHWRLGDRYNTHHLRSGGPSERYTRDLADDIYANIFSKKADYVGRLRRTLGEEAGRIAPESAFLSTLNTSDD